MTKYTMKISRLIIDKLGIKLYDKISAAIAEMISNAYDADATEVIIEAPMGIYLAKKQKDKPVRDSGYEIKIKDNGFGMTPDEINDNYLMVGRDRRKYSGKDVSPKYKRKIMGRKGIGKLAPFGICRFVEIISSGGNLENYTHNGEEKKGYKTAHLILDRDRILEDTGQDYHPEPGERNGGMSDTTGTTVILREFNYRKVPDIEGLKNQIAKRFGVSSKNWAVYLIDTSNPEEEKLPVEVAQFEVITMQNTQITLSLPKGQEHDGLACDGNGEGFDVRLPDGELHSTLKAGFEYEGKFYPVSGWLAYAKSPYKDENMAGVRIYCRKKLAAQTRDFGIDAGFTGEHSVRSYLVGEIRAEWLDEEEDLIHTDRQSILWADELGEKFQLWGRKIIKEVGKISMKPVRNETQKEFMKVSQLEEKARLYFPKPEQKDIREKALFLGEMFGEGFRQDEINDNEIVNQIVKFILEMAPNVVLDDKLREAGSGKFTFRKLSNILKVARTSEILSYGRVVDNHIRIMDNVEKMIQKSSQTIEPDLQKVLEEAPWLINPQWTLVSSNQSFSTIKAKLEDILDEKLSALEKNEKRQRPDFILLPYDGKVQLVEIKNRNHKLENKEMERISNYIVIMNKFLHDPSLAGTFWEFKGGLFVTLVCDETNLSGSQQIAFDACIKDRHLEHVKWISLLERARRVHKSFLDESNYPSRISFEGNDKNEG